MVENYRNLCPTWTLSLLGWIQDFSIRVSMKRQGGHLVGGSAVILHRNLEISSPQKRDFCHSEAKSACFNISFFKVKMPFFLHQNITESSETTMQMCICKTMIKIYCINFIFSILCFVEHGINKKHSSVSFRKKLNHSIVVNGLFVMNVHHSQA